MKRFKAQQAYLVLMFILSVFIIILPGCDDGAGGGGEWIEPPATGTTTPTTPIGPGQVTSTVPFDVATGVCIDRTVSATFSVDMDPLTITTDTFTLTLLGAPVAGVVAYDPLTRIATFNPTADFVWNVDYIATIKGGATGVKDAAGNALATDKVWTFETGTTACVPPPAIGSLTSFAGAMGGIAGITNQGILTIVNGDLGTLAASTLITGFHDSVGDIYTETPLNIGAVTGRIYTAPPPPGGAGVGGNAATFAIAQAAAADALTMYNALVALPAGPDPGAGNLANLVLPPGVYTAAAGSFMIQGGDLTLDAQGDPNAVFVFQMATSLLVGGPGVANPQSVILVGGAQAKNVFWQVGSAATINAAGGGTMVGTIISQAGGTISTAGNVTIATLNGRILSLGASVTMVNTVINVPEP